MTNGHGGGRESRKSRLSSERDDDVAEIGITDDTLPST
jgi:hypothetical protein